MTVARERKVEPSLSRDHVIALCNFLVASFRKVNWPYVEVLTIAPSRFALTAGSASESLRESVNLKERISFNPKHALHHRYPEPSGMPDITISPVRFYSFFRLG